MIECSQRLRSAYPEDGVVLLAEDALAISLCDDGQRQGDLAGERVVLFFREDGEQLAEEGEPELMISNEQTATELERGQRHCQLSS